MDRARNRRGSHIGILARELFRRYQGRRRPQSGKHLADFERGHAKRCHMDGANGRRPVICKLGLDRELLQREQARGRSQRGKHLAKRQLGPELDATEQSGAHFCGVRIDRIFGRRDQAATVYVGEIWLSSDSGFTWNSAGNAPGNTGYVGVAMSSDGTKIAATVFGGTPQYSSDSGQNWTPILFSAAWRPVAMSGDGQVIAAAVAGGSVYVSTNFGTTFTVMNNGIPTTASWKALAVSTDKSKIVAGEEFFGGGQGRLYISSNLGASWTAMTV